MNKDERACLKLGEMVVRTIRELRAQAGSENGYARRKITFPGGEVYMLVANSLEVADALESGAAGVFGVVDAVPRSQVN